MMMIMMLMYHNTTIAILPQNMAVYQAKVPAKAHLDISSSSSSGRRDMRGRRNK